MSFVWLPERETLRKLLSPRTFSPEIWWVGLWRSNASRTRVGLPIPKVEGAAQSGCGIPGVGRCRMLIYVEGSPNVHGRSALIKHSPLSRQQGLWTQGGLVGG
jgi:hypothetical protein